MNRVIAYLPRVMKALVAAVTAGSAAYAGAVDGGVSPEEWVVVVASGIASAVAVWLTPNQPAPTPTNVEAS